MRIEIWSDVVCPWCYIGKRRLETALETFEHRDQVEVVWRSYLLDPGAPEVPVETVAESLGRKYGGGPAGGQRMVDQMEAVAAEEGLLYRLGEAQRVGTVDAHRLLHAAATQSEQARGELKEALLKAYFIDAENVADHDVLVRIAGEVGLDADEARSVLASDRHREEVQADIDQAFEYGAGGVPFFVIDRRFAINGAQPAEVFSQTLDRAWDASHPALTTVGGATDRASGQDAAASCEGGSCTV